MSINKNFIKRIIKGRIAEALFEFMFRETEEYIILPLGYEQSIPEIAQYQHRIKTKSNVLDNLSTLPDYALLSARDKDLLFIIEVKYRSNATKNDILKIAEKQEKIWPISFLFLMTPKGFYYESCKNIIKSQGNITPLSQKYVSLELQKKYLEILNELIDNRKKD